LEKIDQSTVDELFGRLVERARGDTKATSVRYVLDLRLSEQFYEISISLKSGSGKPKVNIDELATTFLGEYERRFERTPLLAQIEVVNWRVQVSLPGGSVPTGGVRPSATFDGRDIGEASKGSREVYLGPLGKRMATVWNRYALTPEDLVEGPAIVEERESTVVVLPGFNAHVDESRNLHISSNSAETYASTDAAKESAR
jgi:N-methylhydantoinase A